MVLVDGGDCFFRAATRKAATRAEAATELRTAKTILSAYNLLGYTALGIGPADLQYGVDELLDLASQAEFPFLCANIVLKSTGKPVFKPYVVIDVGGLRLGIYSVVNNDLHPTYLGRVLPRGEIRDPIEVTREVVKELREKADLIIALSHLNVDDNEKIIAEKLGIDVLLDPISKHGTKALWVNDNEYCRLQDGTCILRIDGQGSRVGMFEMYFGEDSSRLAAFRGYDLPLEPHILNHPVMEERMSESLRSAKALPAGEVDVGRPILVEGFLGQDGCGACHEEQLDFWQKTKHATAMATLRKTEEHTVPECFVCHSYGYGVTFVQAKKLEEYGEVQCESCHGMKEGHAENPKEVRMGTVAEERCWGCHNQAITGMPFRPAEVKAKVSCPKMKR